MQIQLYLMLSHLICFSYFKYSCFNRIITQKFWHKYRHIFKEAKDAQKEPFWTNVQPATVSARAPAGELRMWLRVPCQLGTGSKAPPGSTDLSIQSLVTPAAIPAHNSSHHSSANTEYWDMKELNELEMLCWTPRAVCLAGSSSLPTASLTALELFQVYSTDQTELFTFFSSPEVFPHCYFKRAEF